MLSSLQHHRSVAVCFDPLEWFQDLTSRQLSHSYPCIAPDDALVETKSAYLRCVSLASNVPLAHDCKAQSNIGLAKLDFILGKWSLRQYRNSVEPLYGRETRPIAVLHSVRGLLRLVHYWNSAFSDSGSALATIPQLQLCTLPKYAHSGANLIVRAGGNTGRSVVADSKVPNNGEVIDAAERACTTLMNSVRLEPAAGSSESIHAALARLSGMLRENPYSRDIEEVIYLTAMGQSALPVSEQTLATTSGALEFLEYLGEGYAPALEDTPTAVLYPQWDSTDVDDCEQAQKDKRNRSGADIDSGLYVDGLPVWALQFQIALATFCLGASARAMGAMENAFLCYETWLPRFDYCMLRGVPSMNKVVESGGIFLRFICRRVTVAWKTPQYSISGAPTIDYVSIKFK